MSTLESGFGMEYSTDRSQLRTGHQMSQKTTKEGQRIAWYLALMVYGMTNVVYSVIVTSVRSYRRTDAKSSSGIGSIQNTWCRSILQKFDNCKKMLNNIINYCDHYLKLKVSYMWLALLLIINPVHIYSDPKLFWFTYVDLSRIESLSLLSIRELSWLLTCQRCVEYELNGVVSSLHISSLCGPLLAGFLGVHSPTSSQ